MILNVTGWIQESLILIQSQILIANRVNTMNTVIDKKLQAIEKALNWTANVPEAEQLLYKQELINIRRELN